MPGTGSTCCQRVSPGSSRRQEQEDFRLQRIGVLELVHEEATEAGLKVIADARVVANQVARVEQQIEKVERPFAGLELLIAVDAFEQLLVQQCGEVRVGTQLEVVQRVRQQVSRLEHACARDPLGVSGPTPLPTSLEVAVTSQVHQLCFETIEVCGGFGRRRAGEIRAQASRPARYPETGCRRRTDGDFDTLGERVHERQDCRDRAFAVEWTRVSTRL